MTALSGKRTRGRSRCCGQGAVRVATVQVGPRKAAKTHQWPSHLNSLLVGVRSPESTLRQPGRATFGKKAICLTEA